MKHDAEKYVPVKDRMPAPQTDAELDEISPAARKAMEEQEAQRKLDAEQERRQKGMEDESKGKKPTVKKAKGGSVKSSASKRGDGIAQRGKTKGRMV
jgi:hypothetical protein